MLSKEEVERKRGEADFFLEVLPDQSDGTRQWIRGYMRALEVVLEEDC